MQLRNSSAEGNIILILGNEKHFIETSSTLRT